MGIGVWELNLFSYHMLMIDNILTQHCKRPPGLNILGGRLWEVFIFRILY